MIGIVQTLNVYQFRDAFRRMDRYDQFGYVALGWLFAYLEEYSEATGEPVELDVIALCCDYSVDTWADVAENYSIDVSECEDEEEIRDTVREYLEHHTSIVGCNDDVVLYAVF